MKSISGILELTRTPDSIGLWNLLEIAITIPTRTQTWDVVKSQ